MDQVMEFPCAALCLWFLVCLKEHVVPQLQTVFCCQGISVNQYCTCRYQGTMDKIHSIKFEPLMDSNYLKPVRMTYVQNGVKKFWDMFKAHDSVSILIFNVTRNVFVFVRQFRPAVFFNKTFMKEGTLMVDLNNMQSLPPATQGITLELCAGIVDKKLTIEEIAREEILEECGYDVPVTNLKRIKAYRDSVGNCGDTQVLFYTEVSDEMRVSKGGGNVSEGELIEVVEMSVADAKQYLEKDDVLSPSGFLFALMWFFQNKITADL